MSKEILVADSDKMVQEELERIFEATDHHILFTNNDEEALLRGRLFKPDLIIGGKDLCAAVRSDQELKNIPFIILLDMFDDFSEKERKLLQADGMISRPLNEDEVLSLTNHLVKGVQEGAGEKVMSEDDLDWKSFSDIGKAGAEKREEFSLDGLGGAGEEEEIIELVDVVEEPESRMSIDDFALQQKDEPTGEIAPIESWEKEKVEEKGFEIEEPSLQIEEEAVEKEASPEDELFEKIELEEILRKMERLQPSIEKEWPVVKEEKVAVKIMPERIGPPPQETGERYTGLEEFEAALRGEVKTEPTGEELQPIFVQETKQESPRLASPEEAIATLDILELAEEESPEIFLEELEGELDRLEEVESMPAETAVEVEAETTEEEEISELLGEEVQPQEQALEEGMRVDDLSHMEIETLSPVEEKALSKLAGKEVLPPEKPFEEAIFMQAPHPVEEVASVEELKEAKIAEPEIAEIPKISLGELPPPVVRLDRKIEEVIAKGLQEMMQDFVTKVIPEMAEHMITLSMERIETMVKEIVPDLAEKAIREEIQRLQKGEKD